MVTLWGSRIATLRGSGLDKRIGSMVSRSSRGDVRTRCHSSLWQKSGSARRGLLFVMVLVAIDAQPKVEGLSVEKRSGVVVVAARCV